MLKAILFTGQGFRCKSFSLSTSIPRIIVFKAFVSTNTAILKGLRKSKAGAKRSGSRTKYSEDSNERFPAKSRAEQKYPGARSGVGSKYSDDRKRSFSAELRTLRTEQKYPDARRDSGSKYSGDRKEKISTEPRTFSAELNYPGANKSKFGSKYSGDRGDRKEKFSDESRTFSAEQKHPGARSDFGSNYSGDRNGRFSAEPRTFNAEQRYSGADRSKFGSEYSGDSGDRKERLSAEPRTFSTEQKYPGARSDSRSQYSDDRKGRFSAESRPFNTEQGSNRSTFGSKYSRDSGEKRRSETGFKYNGGRKETFSAELRTFPAEQMYPRLGRDDPGSKYDGYRNGSFSAESRTFTAEQRYTGANRGEPRYKSSGDREASFSTEQKYPRVSQDDYDADRKGRFSNKLRTFTAEEKYPRQKPQKPYHNERDIEGMRGSVALEEGRRTPRQEGYFRGGATESKSFWKQELGTFQGKPPTSTLNTMDRYSQRKSTVDYGPTRESRRTSAYADSIDQLHTSQRPESRRYEREYIRELSNHQKSNNFDAYRRNPQTPIEVHGMAVKSNPPRGIPYTTSASEFLYGTSVVMATLKFSRRKLYKVYVYAGENRSPSSQDGAVRKLALARGVEVANVTGSWLQLMDRMSDGRPHNGYILEASPLPKLPVIGLQRVLSHERALKVFLDHQSREEEAINGTSQDIEYQPGFRRYPFVLLLDGVRDPGNLGAIIRSAFLFGVDAIAISKRDSAPLSPVVLKGSAGAAESLPLLSVEKPMDFISESRQNGWKAYAAILPQSSESWKQESFTNHSLGRPIMDHPCVLMIGGEGEGLARPLQKKADFTVSVEGARMGQGGVDSLNVSVATAMLCDAFLRKAGVLPRIGGPQPEQAGTGETAGGGDLTRSDHTGHVDLNEEDLELDPNVIPDSFGGEEVQQTADTDLGEEESEAVVVDELEAIDETKAHHDLDEESVSIPKNRLF
ncbi:hypothetical protein MMC22_011558 [Lobaria immixta]|nr:hypothetical protein [Lobaria immixta]